MATQIAINVYGLPPLTPEEIIQQMEDKRLGIVRHHETTWLEWEIPEALDEEISEFIKDRILRFQNKCQCEDCKQKRNE